MRAERLIEILSAFEGSTTVKLQGRRLVGDHKCYMEDLKVVDVDGKGNLILRFTDDKVEWVKDG